MDSAVLAGDPCFDRLLAARPYRDRFRRALGVRHGQHLVVLNSTWNPEGLFGDGGDEDVLPSLLPRLTAELPTDDYRLAAVLHPNIWHGHGPGQIRAWLDRARRSGLTLIDPVHHWRQALLAADLVLSDFGAVSYYAAAIETPVLIAATSRDRLDPDTPLAAFHRTAPRLDPHGSLLDQLEKTLANHQPHTSAAEFTSSAPHLSANLLRRRFYALLNLPEPEPPALLEPLPLPPYTPPLRTAPLHVRTRVRKKDVWVERTTSQPYSATGETHLAVHEETRNPADLELAEVIVHYGKLDDPRLGSPARWTAEVLQRHRHCTLAAYITGPHRCTVGVRGRGTYELTAHPGADADPAAYASALHAWLTTGRTVPARGTTLRVRLASETHPVAVNLAALPRSSCEEPRDTQGADEPSPG